MAHEKDFEAKYQCLEKLGIQGKGEYCLWKYQEGQDSEFDEK